MSDTLNARPDHGRLFDIASEQSGFFTADQAHTCNFTLLTIVDVTEVDLASDQVQHAVANAPTSREAALKALSTWSSSLLRRSLPPACCAMN
ncbi:MAG TPA: hypothetical protein VIU62_03370 [Chloroflexota bacterium]